MKKDYLTLVFSANMVNLLKKSNETQKVWLYWIRSFSCII